MPVYRRMRRVPSKLLWRAVSGLGLCLLCAHLLFTVRGEASSAMGQQGSRCDRAMFRVVIDVGHTAEAPGALSARGIPEYEFNLRLAKLTTERLVEAGFESSILLVTGGPARAGLSERVARANTLRADLFVSIHHDSVPQFLKERWEFDGQPRSFSDRFKGHSIFVSSNNRKQAASLSFASALGQELKGRGLEYTPHYMQSMMGPWRRTLVNAEVGVYRYDQLIVLRTTRMPAVLLEAGSIVNREEELLLASPERQRLIAESVVSAVEKFCASKFRPGTIASTGRTLRR
jgi:N-acetylmuramoyl-L-alanine amidase